MTSAYCLTCNEQVAETPAGTCPEGHPVSSQDVGPEPWVGHAGGRRTEASSDQPLWRDLDVDELQEPVTGERQHAANGNGATVNGSAGGSTARGTVTEAAPGIGTNGDEGWRQPANGTASDELSAMLAEALGGQGNDATATPDRPSGFSEPASPAPEEPAAAAEAAAPEEPAATPEPVSEHGDDAATWDDLATLAAELQLDDRAPVDAAPSDAAPAADPAPSDVPAADAPTADHAPPAGDDGGNVGDDDSAATWAELEAAWELPATEEPRHEPAAPQPRTAVEELAQSLGLDMDEDVPAGDTDTEAPAPRAAAPPPPTSDPLPSPSSDPLPPPADSRMAPPPPPVEPAPDFDPVSFDLALDEYDPTPEPSTEDSTSASRVDLTNFTAKGRRVGGGSVPPGVDAPKSRGFGRRR